MQMTQSVLHFLRDHKAATAIEYALIASGIALAIVATVTALGTQVNGMFTSVSSAFNNSWAA
jgi:pilus assembly protein Flp/PilA